MKKIMVSLFLCCALLMGFSTHALADTGRAFGADSISIPVDVGTVNGAANGKFYHLTPGNASIYVSEVSNPTDVSLRIGRYFPTTICTVYVTSTGWYTLPGLSKDSSDYSLYIAAYATKDSHTASIHGELHDHTAP